MIVRSLQGVEADAHPVRHCTGCGEAHPTDHHCNQKGR